MQGSDRLGMRELYGSRVHLQSVLVKTFPSQLKMFERDAVHYDPPARLQTLYDDGY